MALVPKNVAVIGAALGVLAANTWLRHMVSVGGKAATTNKKESEPPHKEEDNKFKQRRAATEYNGWIGAAVRMYDNIVRQLTRLRPDVTLFSTYSVPLDAGRPTGAEHTVVAPLGTVVGEVSFLTGGKYIHAVAPLRVKRTQELAIQAETKDRNFVILLFTPNEGKSLGRPKDLLKRVTVTLRSDEVINGLTVYSCDELDICGLTFHIRSVIDGTERETSIGRTVEVPFKTTGTSPTRAMVGWSVHFEHWLSSIDNVYFTELDENTLT